MGDCENKELDEFVKNMNKALRDYNEYKLTISGKHTLTDSDQDSFQSATD